MITVRACPRPFAPRVYPRQDAIDHVSNLANFPLGTAGDWLGPASILSGSRKAARAETLFQVTAGTLLAMSGATTLASAASVLHPAFGLWAQGLAGAGALLDGASGRGCLLKMTGGALMMTGANLMLHDTSGGTATVAAGALLNLMADNGWGRRAQLSGSV